MFSINLSIFENFWQVSGLRWFLNPQSKFEALFKHRIKFRIWWKKGKNLSIRKKLLIIRGYTINPSSILSVSISVSRGIVTIIVTIRHSRNVNNCVMGKEWWLENLSTETTEFAQYRSCKSYGFGRRNGRLVSSLPLIGINISRNNRYGNGVAGKIVAQTESNRACSSSIDSSIVFSFLSLSLPSSSFRRCFLTFNQVFLGRRRKEVLSEGYWRKYSSSPLRRI